MIDVSNLTKRYGPLKAIDNLSFHIDKGEIIGFLGPNGAGKTTTVKIITCFMPPSEGEVTVDGLSIFDNSYEIRQRIGFLPENNPLYLDLTVKEYLSFIADIRSISTSLRPQKIDRVVTLCQLNEVFYKPIGQLSKGYRQRVGLAQALIHAPKLLILDEPTSGLDPNQIIEIRNLLKKLGKETTIIMCSHILSEVSATCSRVFILNNGVIVADGTPKELTKSQKGEYVTQVELNQTEKTLEKSLTSLAVKFHSIQVVSSNKDFSKLSISSKEDIRDTLYNLSVENKWKLRELRMDETSLEDIFIQLTKAT